MYYRRRADRGPPRVQARSADRLVPVVVSYLRQRHPCAPIIADPEASNGPSRGVLEKNGFELLGERSVHSEPTEAPMAIYRLQPEPFPVVARTGGAPNEGSGSR
jgi:hypothetical protein